MSANGRGIWVSSKKQDDCVAQTIIGRALNVKVRVHDDNSEDNMFDLEFAYPQAVAAEVVSNRQKDLQMTGSQIRKAGYKACDQLSRVWTVTINHGHSPLKLARRIVPLLEQIESHGMEDADNIDLYDLYEDADEKWPEIASIRSRPPSARFTAGYEITMSGWSGWVGSGDDVLTYVEDQIDTQWADVVSKLRDTGKEETHAVVLLTYDVPGPITAIEDGKTPVRPPQLPDNIHGLWIVARGVFPLRGVYFLPGQGWQEVTITSDEYLAVHAEQD